MDGLCIDPNDCSDFSGYWYSYQGDPNYNIFIIDLLSSVPIAELHFLPLQIHSYTIWTSDNNTDWTERHNATGPFPGYVIPIPVNGAYSARYIKYEGSNGTNAYVGIGEFEVYATNRWVCNYDPGTSIMLTAVADLGSTFTGWSGSTGSASACTGTGTCSFTITADSGVTANFTRPVISPEEGTIGTRVTITGPDFGTKKGKVLIGGAALMIAKDGWQPGSITGIVKKVPPVGIHDVVIIPSMADEIPLSNAFTVKLPEIDLLSDDHGAPGVSRTITGDFFSIKKGKVYLDYDKNGQPKKKNCKVTSWAMDSITFMVPKGLTPATYPLKVINKVGTAEAPSGFTVDLQ